MRTARPVSRRKDQRENMPLKCRSCDSWTNQQGDVVRIQVTPMARPIRDVATRMDSFPQRLLLQQAQQTATYMIRQRIITILITVTYFYCRLHVVPK